MASNQQSPSQSSHGAPNANDAQIPSPDSPYYIHPSETPDTFKPPLVLSGSNNYSNWYRAMSMPLASKKKLGFVNGTIAVPGEDDPIYRAWKQCDELVLSWIRKALSSEIADSVHGMDKAVDVWRDLKNRFSPGDDRFIILDIGKDMLSLRQGEGTVASYFTGLALLWSQLEILDPLPACACVTKCSCGAVQSVKEREEKKVVEFLKGLDDRFAAARSRIIRENPLPSIDKIFTWAVQEETQMISGANQTTQESQGLYQHHSQSLSFPSTSIQVIPKTQPGKEEVTRTKKLVLRIHPHPLTFKDAGAPYECSGCQELGFGPSYRCENGECNYVLHEVCADAAVGYSTIVRHPFYGESNFSFLEKPHGWPRHCDACRKIVRGFVYHRPDNGRPDDTGLDLHPCCFKLKDSISDEEGQVTLKLIPTIPKKCLRCNSQKVEEDESKVKGWSYVSPDEKYCRHVSCFKKMIMEKWKEGYFSEKEMLKQTNDPKTRVPLTGKEMVKDGESLKGSGIMKVASNIASVVLQLIFTAIFGDPVSFVLTLVQALAGIFIA